MLLKNLKTLRKNSDFLSFDRSNVPLDRSKKLKFRTWPPDLFDRYSIASRSIEKQIRSIDYQSKINLLKKSDLCFTRSIESVFRSIETRETRISRNFLRQFSRVFLEQTTNCFDIFIVLPSKTLFDFINEDFQIKHRGFKDHYQES